MALNRFVLALLALGMTSPLAATQPDYDSFGAFLEEFRKSNSTPSLSAVIVRDGAIAWEGYFGTYDDEGELPTRAETTYKIGSVTKPIVATAILAESIAGELSLGIPMAKDKQWKELCEYFVTTPISFMSGGEDRHGNSIPQMACDKPTTLADMLHMRANTADSFVYNPIAFAGIDRAISAANGRDLRDIVRDRVAGPAGMKDAALGWRDPDGGAALRYLAEPFHVVDGRVVKQPLPDDDFRAAAGIIANPRAIAAFDIALGENRIGVGWGRGSTWGKRFLAGFEETEIGPLGDYRLGWFLENWNGRRLMWHSGWNDKKYSALYLKVPEMRLTLIVMANTEAVWWGNSVVKAEVVESPIALRFLEDFAQ